MTFVHWIITYLMEYWHEFARTVHLETKKGKSGFWHSLNMWLVAIPVGGILMVMSLVMLVAAMMFVVPIAKLVGYDLGARFSLRRFIVGGGCSEFLDFFFYKNFSFIFLIFFHFYFTKMFFSFF